MSWATWLLFIDVYAPRVVLHQRWPGQLGSCSLVCTLRVFCCVCGVLGNLAPVHRRACSVWCAVCAVSWAIWLLFGSVPARCVVLYVRCPGPLGSCSLVSPLGVLCPVCGVQGRSAHVHRCVCSACCVACAVSLVTWLLFTGVPAQCFVLYVRYLGPLSSFSPVRTFVVLCCVCAVLSHLAPVHGCVRSLCCVACAVFRATWLLFRGLSVRCDVLYVRCPGPSGPYLNLYAWRVVLRVRCPAPLGSCSPVCTHGLLCCMYVGHVVFCVRCPGPLSSCLLVHTPGVLCCVCGVLGHLVPIDQCARCVCCYVCAVSCATWLLCTSV